MPLLTFDFAIAVRASVTYKRSTPLVNFINYVKKKICYFKLEVTYLSFYQEFWSEFPELGLFGNSKFKKKY